ncbi:NAD(P)-dependent oxidoreductase [marine bacterium AO1-C]|nr:NAD(P)-dependent oxidoreductase [marine bacterium AO1-C]
MTQQTTISILGCGWIGFPLARHLVSKGLRVKGSTTQINKLESLQNEGIEPFLIKLTPDIEAPALDDFLDTDTLFINIPPGVRSQGEDFHPAQITNLLPHLKQSRLKNIIYVSSTSVYPNVNREVNEDEPLPNQDGSVDGVGSKGVNRALLKGEQMIRSLSEKNVTIVRPGGLIGEDRIPGRYVAGREGLTGGNNPVNYIHPVDLVRMITEIIQQNVWEDTFNIVAPQHPPRKAVYAQNAKMFGFELPKYAEGATDFKIINADKLVKRLNYQFKYPNPLEFRYKT